MNLAVDTTKEAVLTFEADTIGSPPAGMTEVGTNNIYDVDSTNYWYGDRCLMITGGGSINHNFIYGTPTNLPNGDYEIRGLFRFDDFAGDRLGLVFRAWNDSGTHRSFGAFLYNSNSLRLSSFSGTTESVKSTQAAGITYATDTWYWIKVLTSGTSIKATVWKIDTDEPTTWIIDTTSSDIDNTHIGFGVYGRIGNGNNAFADYIRVYKRPALPNPTPADESEEMENVWASWKEDYIRWDGAVVRPDPDRDIVSEGPAYGLKLAVQLNDQTAFDLVEDYCFDFLERGVNGETDATHLMSWLVNLEVNNDVSSTDFATDGDNDRVVALLWAHARWGSAGAINYLARALDIIADLRNFTFNNDGGMEYQIPYASQLGLGTFEVNPSYLDPSAFKLFKQYDTGNETFWDNAVAGSYDLITKNTDNAGGLPTTAGLPSEWVDYNTTTNDVATAGQDNYGFNAFRVLYRLYWDYLFYASAEASTWFGAQIADFFDTYYTTNGFIRATYDHDGTNPSAFSLSYFYWAAYYALLVDSKANAATVLTNELSSQYNVSGSRAWYGTDSYYGVWSFFAQLEQQDILINYGQSSGTDYDIGLEEVVGVSSLRDVIISKILSETAGVSSAITNAVTKLLTLSENIGITDVVNSLIRYVIALDEVVGISETFTKATTFIKSLIESVGLTDVFTRVGSFTRTFAETAGVTDLLGQIKALNKVLEEIVGVTDTTIKSITKSFLEAVGVVDTVIKKGIKSFVELVGAIDSISFSSAGDLLLSEVIALNDSILRGITRTFNENVAVNDVTTRVKSLIRSFTEQLAVNDMFSNARTLVINLSETVGLNDLFSGIRVIIKRLEEVIGIDDRKSFAITTIFTEVVGIIDRFTRDTGEAVKAIFIGIRKLGTNVSVTKVYSRITATIRQGSISVDKK